VSQIVGHVTHHMAQVPRLLAETQRRYEQDGVLLQPDLDGLLGQLAATYTMHSEHAVHGGGSGVPAANSAVTFF